MNLLFLGSTAKLIGYLKANSLTEEELFSPSQGVSWGSSYHWIDGHSHPALDDFLSEVKFGKPLRVWTISIMTPDVHVRLIEALDENSKFGRDFVVHSERNITLPHTITGRLRFINSLAHKGKSRKPWALNAWPAKLEDLARRKE